MKARQWPQDPGKRDLTGEPEPSYSAAKHARIAQPSFPIYVCTKNLLQYERASSIAIYALVNGS